MNNSQQYSPLQIQAAKELLSRRQARKNLIPFCTYTKQDFKVAKFHQEIANDLEAVERGEIKRLIIQAPRRHGKSEVCSRRFPAFYLGRNPTKQIINISYGDELSSSLGRDVRNLIDSRIFQNCFKTKLSDDSNAANRFNTPEGGAYVSAGIGGPVTGKGAHVLMIDDPHKNMDEAQNTTMQEKVYRYFTDTLVPTLMPDVSAIVVIMSPWCKGDFTDRLLQESKDNWIVRSYPACQYSDTVPSILQGPVLAPQWASLEFLDSQRQTMGDKSFDAEYLMIRREKRHGALWDQDDLDRDRVTQTPELELIVVAIDPAVTSNASSDETGISACGYAGGHYYVLADESISDKPENWANKAVSLYDRLGANFIVGEVNNGGDLIESVIRNAAQESHRTISYAKVTASRGKIVRAEPIADLSKRGLFHLVGKFPKLEKQMVNYTGLKTEKSPDRMEAMVWAIKKLMERVDVRVTRL